MDVQTFFFRRTNMNALGQPRSWTDHLLWHHAAHTVDLFAYQARSYTHLALRHGDAAQADALASLKLRDAGDQHLAYGVIVGYLGLRQAGKAAEATTFLATWGPKADSTAWPFPVIKFLGHTLTATALLAQATDDNKMTEARTYVALDLIYAGTPQAARPHLEWVKLHGTRTYFEYPVALAELRRLQTATH